MPDFATFLLGSIRAAPWGWALLATVLLALIRVWPALSRQAMEERAKIRGERREDLAGCVARCDILQAEIDKIKDEVSVYQAKLTGTLIAYRIVEGAHEVDSPGSVAVTQARSVLRLAYSIGELPDDWADMLRKAG